MAREQKPGRFKYSLETVLKVRAIKERKEQEKFALKQKEYLDQKQKEDELTETRSEKQGELRTIMRKGPISDFSKVLQRKAHLSHLKDEIDTQIEKVIDASQKLDEQRGQLLTAMKDKKIIEKNKEHRFDDYKKMMSQLESKFMDEIATVRHTREKKKS